MFEAKPSDSAPGKLPTPLQIAPQCHGAVKAPDQRSRAASDCVNSLGGRNGRCGGTNVKPKMEAPNGF